MRYSDKKQKKILFIFHEGSMTGAPLFLHRFLNALKTTQPNIDILVHCAADGPLVQIIKNEGFYTISFNKSEPNTTKLKKIYLRIKYYLNLSILFLKHKPDLIYSNTITNTGQVILARLFPIKVIVHMHEGREFASRMKFKLKLSSLFTTKYIVGSEYVNKTLKEYCSKEGVVIYNGIDWKSILKKISPEVQPCFTLGILGTIDSNKGQLVAIKAVDHLIKHQRLSIKLKIAGQTRDQAYYDILRNYIERNDLSEHIELMGPIPRKSSFYNSIDAVVVPSFDEAFPTVILEAMAYKKIVLASETGGITEIITDHEDGLLFTSGDYMHLAGQIVFIITNPKNTLEMINKAHLKIEMNFSLSKSNKKIIAVINELFKS